MDVRPLSHIIGPTTMLLIFLVPGSSPFRVGLYFSSREREAMKKEVH